MKDVARKWYNLLNFPKEFDVQFENLLNRIELLDLTVEEFNQEKYQADEILIYYLYFCERLSKKYKEKGILETILMDTLSDLVIWCKVYYSLTGKIGIGVSDFIKNHLSFKLFKLGRLQFCKGAFSKDYDAISVKKGDSVLEIHIPETGKLVKEDCEFSIKKAKEFFNKFFPEFKFKYFSCNSWLLDDTLKDMLNENSNIVRFSDMFEKIDRVRSDNVLKYVFRWDARRDNVNEFLSKSSFTDKIKAHINNNGNFYEVLGVIKND